MGYLSYDSEDKTVKIPNGEVRAEYVNTISVSDWGPVSEALKHSAGYLAGNLRKDGGSGGGSYASGNTLKRLIFSIMMKMH